MKPTQYQYICCDADRNSSELLPNGGEAAQHVIR